MCHWVLGASWVADQPYDWRMISGTRVLGIDLGGAVTRSTGYALIEPEDSKPNVVEVGILPKAKTPAEGEEALLKLITDRRPDLIAVDAPLTLPPCMSCNLGCPGASEADCLGEEAKKIWKLDGHPLTQRLCEKELNRTTPEFDGTHPQRTMGLGLITARGVALARRHEGGGFGDAGRPVQLIEVYPYGTLRRLKIQTRQPKQDDESFRKNTINELGKLVSGLGSFDKRTLHEMDAVIAAYTGWLEMEGRTCVRPDDWPQGSGWITLPKPA